MLPSLKAAAVAVTATGALLVGGVAVAATGALPGAAQDSAQTVLSNLGVSVPGPNAHAGTHPDGTSADDTEDVAATTAPAPATTAPAPVASPAATESANAHGKAVSDLAHSTTATGAAKGAEISALASGGKSRAGGEHGQPTPTTTTTAPTATDGTSDAQDHGATQSGGHGGATHQP